MEVGAESVAMLPPDFATGTAVAKSSMMLDVWNVLNNINDHGLLFLFPWIQILSVRLPTFVYRSGQLLFTELKPANWSVDFVSYGVNRGGAVSDDTLYSPSSDYVMAGRLYVADRLRYLTMFSGSSILHRIIRGFRLRKYRMLAKFQ